MLTRGDKDIRGLDVTVHNAFAVGSIQCIGDFDGQRQHRLDFHRSVRDSVLQRLAIQEFHRDKASTILFADLIDSADTMVVESRGRASFATKASQRLRIARNIVREKLKRNRAAERKVFGFIDNTHAAVPQFFDKAVV